MSPSQIAAQLSDLLRRRVVLWDGPLRRIAAEPVGDSDRGGVDVRYGRGGGALRILGARRGDLDTFEWSVIDAATYLLDLALGVGAATHKDWVLNALVDDDRDVRRDALWEVRARRWVDSNSEGIDVLAVILDGISEVGQVAFGRHLAAITHRNAQFIGLHLGAALFACAPTLDVTEVGRAAEVEASRHRARVRGLAVASCPPSAADIEDAAERAVHSARLRGTLPGQVGSARAEDLGGWSLLHTLPRSRSLLTQASPAAIALAASDDPTQRETVEVYLDAAGRANVTCELLHIHRTTLYYRLERMPDSVREALADGMQRSTLHLALKLLRLWEEEEAASAPVVTVPFDPTRHHDRLGA